MRWRRWRRPLGGCLIVLLIPIVFLGWVLNQIQSPYQSPGSVSPQGQWRVWLERPEGSMESIYYTLKARRESIFATPVCDVGSITNLFAERYTRMTWSSPNRMRFDYGLSDRDTGSVGAPHLLPVPKDCAGLAIELRHDRSLDAEATRTNSSNHHYAVPVPDRDPFPMTPTDTPSPLPLS